MAIDSYAPCPGGTGKKIKFCCSDLVGDLEQLDRLIEGDQITAALDQALEELRPHHLCTYLHELAAAYGTFYAADSVIVDDPAVKARRLMLCARTCAVMETGLRLLGIEPVERM